MSWFSANYEKALIGGSALIALGVVYFGWNQIQAVEKDFKKTLAGNGNQNTAVVHAEQIPKAIQSMQSDHRWTQGIDDKRPVDLFTGIPLFVNRGEPNKAIDLLNGPQVHPGIPNQFWLENRIDPGFADSPARDPDADGFSNLEEFLAKTDPRSSDSHPVLLSKLRYVKDDSITWLLRPGFGSQIDPAKPEMQFSMNYDDSRRRQNKASPAEMIAPGALFFVTEPIKGRFKLLGQVSRIEHNPRTNVDTEVIFVRIEDQKPNKRGKIYEIPAPLGKGQEPKYTQYDRSAVLSLEALGLEGKEFVVEENMRFSLPSNGSSKDYLLKSVSPRSIVVEYPAEGGGRKDIEIPKGGMPKL